jgi:SOUL heme-binding protein
MLPPISRSPSLTETMPSIVSDDGPIGPIETQAKKPLAWRKVAFWSSLAAIPAAAGIAYGLASTRRRGIALGGLAALGLGIARVEFARWFTQEPAYERLGRIRDLEVRRYPGVVEARVAISDPDLRAALDRGYGKLACYVYGHNTSDETIDRTAPVLLAMRDGYYAVSFIMPPGQSLANLPSPTHPEVELTEIPPRDVAVLGFHGRYTRDNIARHERTLLDQLIDAGLSARGSIMFAAFDSPFTLPVLRRNELWIELV